MAALFLLCFEFRGNSDGFYGFGTPSIISDCPSLSLDTSRSSHSFCGNCSPWSISAAAAIPCPPHSGSTSTMLSTGIYLLLINKSDLSIFSPNSRHSHTKNPQFAVVFMLYLLFFYSPINHLLLLHSLFHFSISLFPSFPFCAVSGFTGLRLLRGAIIQTCHISVFMEQLFLVFFMG